MLSYLIVFGQAFDRVLVDVVEEYANNLPQLEKDIISSLELLDVSHPQPSPQSPNPRPPPPAPPVSSPARQEINHSGLEDSQSGLQDTDIIITREIGIGLLTSTFEGTLRSNGERVAIKKPLIEMRRSSEVGQAAPASLDEFAKVWENEIAIMTLLGNHPNVCRFIGASLDTRHDMFVVYEYLSGGSLQDVLRDPTSTFNRKEIAMGVAQALKHLHGLGVIHRDVKSANVMLDGSGKAKLVDFGLAVFAGNESDLTAETGTYRWMAPEVIRHDSYSYPVDVYSFGILLWELVARALPYAGLTPVQAAFAVAKSNLRPQIPPETSTGLKALIGKCWHPNPTARPPFRDICLILRSVG